jgi:hypothetical protein
VVWTNFQQNLCGFWCDFFNNSFMQEGGVDLAILSAVLNPYDQVVEADTPWEFETLFVKISTELQSELEKKDKENEEEKEPVEESSQPGRL